MNNCSHGPFRSGRNRESFEEAAKALSQRMTEDEFSSLIDHWYADLCITDSDDAEKYNLPESPEDIPNLDLIKNLPVYVTCWPVIF